MVKNVCDPQKSDLQDPNTFENRISILSDGVVLWKETEQTFEMKIPNLYSKFDQLIAAHQKIDIIFDIREIMEIRLSPIQRKLCRKFFESKRSKLIHACIVTNDQTFLRLTSKLLMRNYFEYITFHNSIDEALELINLSNIMDK